ARFCQPNSVYRQIRRGRAPLRYGRALELRAPARRYARDKAVAGVGGGGNLGDGGRTQPAISGSRRASRFFVSAGGLSRSALLVSAEESWHPGGIAGHSRAPEGFCQRTRELRPSDTSCL